LGSKGLLAFLEATREVGHAAAPRYIPITMGPQRLPHLAEDGDRSCLNLMHAIERRAAVDARPERVKLGQESRIQSPWNALIDEERLDFRGEQNSLAGSRVVERLDADSVAGQDQPPAAFVPDGDGEVAIEVAGKVAAPFLVGVRNDFGIGA